MFNTELPIQIVISGALLNQLTVTTIFNKGGIVLHPPNATQLGGRRYLPPQRPEPARQSYAAYTEAQQVNQYQQAKNQLDDVYDAMRGWEDLEETHPSEDLVTKTYPHQRQALTFMLQREQDPDERDGGLNLWRKSGAGFSYRCIIDESITRDSAVRELRGGLVADDMGVS